MARWMSPKGLCLLLCLGVVVAAGSCGSGSEDVDKTDCPANAMLQSPKKVKAAQMEVSEREEEMQPGEDLSLEEEGASDTAEEEELEDVAAESKSRHDAKWWGRRRARRRRTPAPTPRPTPRPTPAPTPAPYYGPYCSQSPASWRDSEGKTCGEYSSNSWCTPSGGKGNMWWWRTWYWNDFSHFARDGVHAGQACCECGGGKDRLQKLCEVSEKSVDYGMSFSYHTDTYYGCESHKCNVNNFLSSGAAKAFEAVPMTQGSCGCWAVTEAGATSPTQPNKVFLFSHVPASGGCNGQTCWDKYATALRIFKGGDGTAMTSSAQDPQSTQHWQTTCRARELHLESDHATGFPTVSQLIHTLTSWDALDAVDELLQILSVQDELSYTEAVSLGGGHGSSLPTDTRSVLAHISGKWNEFTDDALDFLKGLGLDILDVLTLQGEMTIKGTTFTTQNYYSLMGSFLIAGMTSNSAMKKWYTDLSGGTMIGNGPGPNTKTYYSNSHAKALMEGLGAKFESGEAERENELGMQILNGLMWPDAPGGQRSIGLGYNRENHAFVRPTLADVLDLARGGSECDGSTCWSPEWLRSKARWFFQSRDSFESGDFKWFNTIILHKIHMNIDITVSEAKAFAEFMNKVVIAIPFAENQVNNWLVKTVLGVADTHSKRAVYLEKFKAAIRAKWPQRRYTDPEVHLLASGFLDSLLFAGGLSVPSALAYVTGLTHQNEGDKWPELRGVELNDQNIPGIIRESMRLYPPVGGFPWWEKVPGGGWKHEIINVGMTMSDPAVFSNPDVFHVRDVSYYEQHSLGWADRATYVNGKPNEPHDSPEAIRAPHTHRCPGKDLSIQIMIATLQEFVAAGPWEALDGDISINAYAAGSHTLKKRAKTAMCWSQPSECVWSWNRWFSSESGCVKDSDGGDPWCSHYSYYVPTQWSRCTSAPCTSAPHVGESLADTERVAMTAYTQCKQGSASTSSKANCVCSYADDSGSSKTMVQRCSALTNIAQDIAPGYSCVIKKTGNNKECAVYVPWYLQASHAITQSWNAITKWTLNHVPTDVCYSGNSRICSQDNLAVRSAKCSDLNTSILTDDWLGMPQELQGYFWLQKQGDSSSLISFGKTRDGGGMSPGTVPSSGKYPIRVGGDRGWSFATTDGGSFGFVEAVDLIYEFQFNNAASPTFAQIIPKVRNVLGLSVPPWLLSFDMRLTSNSNYADSVVWQRKSSVVGIGADSADYQAVQVIDGAGNKLGAFNEWVQYCEDASKSGSSSPGYIWYHTYDREPFSANTLQQELSQCPSILTWVAPAVIDKAFMLSQSFGSYSFRSVFNDGRYDDTTVFDDFTLLVAIGMFDINLKIFEGAHKTPGERMCPPTVSRPMDKFRAQESLAPLEELDTHGSCVAGTAFSSGQAYMCAMLMLSQVEFKDDMNTNHANTWAKALQGKPAGTTKSDWLMSFTNFNNADGDPAYPVMQYDWTQHYFQEGLGFDDMLETKLTIDLLGTHLVEKVTGTAPSKGGSTATMVCKMNQLSGLARRQGFARFGGDMYFSADGRPIMVEIVQEDGSKKQVWADAPRTEWEYAKFVHRSTMFMYVTLVDHLWFTHLSVANKLATVAREKLLPNHPLRRLTSMATFGTIEVNADASHVLLAPNAVLQRSSPFSDWDNVHDIGEDAIKTFEGYYGAIIDKSKQNAFPDRLKAAPFYQDAPDLYAVLSNFVDDFFGVYSSDWCASGTDLIKDQDLRDFARGMEDWLTGERPNRAAANLAWAKGTSGGAWTCAAVKKLLKVQLFTVSGMHQHAGKVADLVRNPELVSSSWAPGETSARPRQAMQIFLVSGGTAFLGVKLNSDFTPLFNGIPKSSQAKAVLNTFKSNLGQLKNTLEQRNRDRDIPYTRMHPDYAEISVFQ